MFYMKNLVSFWHKLKSNSRWQQCYLKFFSTVKPVYNGHTWDPKKVAVVQRLRHKWSLFTVYQYKIFKHWGSSWPLQTGGRCSEVAVNTGLTVHLIFYEHILKNRIRIVTSKNWIGIMRPLRKQLRNSTMKVGEGGFNREISDKWKLTELSKSSTGRKTW